MNVYGARSDIGTSAPGQRFRSPVATTTQSQTRHRRCCARLDNVSMDRGRHLHWELRSRHEDRGAGLRRQCGCRLRCPSRLRLRNIIAWTSNNAGVSWSQPFLDVTTAKLRTTQETRTPKIRGSGGCPTALRGGSKSRPYERSQPMRSEQRVTSFRWDVTDHHIFHRRWVYRRLTQIPSQLIVGDANVDAADCPGDDLTTTAILKVGPEPPYKSAESGVRHRVGPGPCAPVPPTPPYVRFRIRRFEASQTETLWWA